MHEVTHIKQSDGSRKPHPIVAFKATIKMAAQAAYKGPPLRGPLRVDAVYVFPREASKFWRSKPMPRYRHTSAPDVDNLQKAMQDALNGILWADDAQICDGRLQKWRAAGDEQPHVTIIVTPLA
jgi:Holliday junction resolvase RusA-like endonuclease